MSGPLPLALPRTDRQLSVLLQITRRQHAPLSLVRRARIVVLACAGKNNTEIGVDLECSREIVRTWRQRWHDGQEQVAILDDGGASDGELVERISLLLSDQPRSGAPPTFSEEQVVEVVALACTVPGECGVPLSHWTASALAREAVRRGLAPAMSDRTVTRFLKSGGLAAPSQPLLADGCSRGPRRLPRAGERGVHGVPGGRPPP